MSECSAEVATSPADLAQTIRKAAQASEYRYDPLADAAKEIRLLSLASQDTAGRLCFKCEAFDLLAAPAYYAISYTWGEKLPLNEIRLNGYSMRVRENCHYALWQAQQHDKDGYFWNDAICIDQRNDIEKGHQVAMMGEIYAQAKCVLACIGPHGDDSRFCFEQVPKAYKYYQERRSASTVLSKAEFTAVWLGMLPKDSMHRAQRSIRCVSRRPYFQRLWIVQEVHKAQEVVFLCGASKMDGEAFARFAFQSALAERYGLTSMLSSDQDAKFQLATLLQITNPILRPGDSRTTSLLRHVQDLYSLGCAEVRDRVYAMLSISTKPTGFQCIHPRYSCSLVDLIMSALTYRDAPAMGWTSCISVLLYVLDCEQLHHEMDSQVEARQPDASGNLPVSTRRDSEVLMLQGSVTNTFRLHWNGFSLFIPDVEITVEPQRTDTRSLISEKTVEAMMRVADTARDQPQKVLINDRCTVVVCPQTRRGDYLVELHGEFYIVVRVTDQGCSIIGHALLVQVLPNFWLRPKGTWLQPDLGYVCDAQDLLTLVYVQEHAEEAENHEAVLKILSMRVCHRERSSYLVPCPRAEALAARVSPATLQRHVYRGSCGEAKGVAHVVLGMCCTRVD